jgi:hypothetical protein
VYNYDLIFSELLYLPGHSCSFWPPLQPCIRGRRLTRRVDIPIYGRDKRGPFRLEAMTFPPLTLWK